MYPWLIVHSTVSFGRRITLAPSRSFLVWAGTEDAAIERARQLGMADLLGFRFDGVVRADLVSVA